FREPIPQRALGIGRIAPQEFGQPAHRRIRAARLFAAVLRQQCAQPARLLIVENAAARRSLAPLRNRHDDAAQGLDVLLRRLHAREDVAQVDLHRLALIRRAEELDLLQLALEILEETEQLLARRRIRFAWHLEWKLAAANK